GFFTREFHLGYAFTETFPDGSDGHLGIFQFQTPLSRRVWLGIDVPFIVGQEGSGIDSDAANFGDLVITPRVMLHETENLSISAGLSIELPTGEIKTGGDQTTLAPFVALWTDVGAGVSVRSGAGLAIPTDDFVTSNATFIYNLSIGQTITPHDQKLLGDFTYYLAMNLRQNLGGDVHTFFSFTPGIRAHIACDTFFLFGYEVPVTGPRDFDQRFNFLIVKGF